MRQQLSWIEYLATNQRVGGSNPSWRANLHQLHFQGYYSSSVLETVNKIIYHTAEQVQLLHCDNIHFVFRLIVSINALASLRSLTPTQSDVTQLYQQYSMYTRSAECAAFLNCDCQSVVCSKSVFTVPLPCYSRDVLRTNAQLSRLQVISDDGRHSICTAFDMRQVGIYTADLRLVYQIKNTRASSVW